ncbi:MAG: transketolase family protein [Thermoplasmata archaeon]|nr:transketolase family protein [Thermoplasmata archaeon]MCI4359723.1 transketolase family protein [Thermoplasmata archaeon]
MGRSDPELVVVDADFGRPTRESPFSKQFPYRFFDVTVSDPVTVSSSARLAGEGRTVAAYGLAGLIAGQGYYSVRESICRPRARVRFLADPTTSLPQESGGSPPMVEDIGLMRGLPGMTVVCPADPASAGSAMRAVAALEGPAYVRLGPDDAPNVTDGVVELGRAQELRPGRDLTVAAIGPAVSRALEVARALSRVGVEVRVLDLASVKPFDIKAVLRAARETGAILCLEQHSVVTGVGSLVAACTAEEYPVPVRRLGSPDLFPGGASGVSPDDPYGLALDHCLEEAYELLRARGKVQ